MKKLAILPMILVATLLSTSPFTAAQTQIPTNPDYPISTEAQSLKAQILAIASQNQTRLDNLSQVRSQLDPLINRLITITPPRTETQKLYQVLGSWRQVWSDAPFFGPTRFGSYDLRNIYQVVFNGYYWNISRFITNDQTIQTGFLRGKFGVTPESLKPVFFTKDVFGIGDIPRNSNIITYAIRAESGEYNSQRSMGFSPVGFPQSPLINEYVDDDFRILTNPMTPLNPKPAIFILERSSLAPLID